MELFKIFVLIISISIFIGLFIYTAVTFYNNKPTLFPPDLTACPDYWQLRPDGTCQLPKSGDPNLGALQNKGHIIYEYNINGKTFYSALPKFYDIKGVYKGSDKKQLTGYYNTDIPYGYDDNVPQNNWVDFTDSGWASFGDPYCEIQKWANVNNIQWDGMASYNKCLKTPAA